MGYFTPIRYRFHAPEQIPEWEEIEMEPPPGFRRAHGRTPMGTWSDDGAQALALLDSLLTCGALDLDDFGRRLVAWYNQAAYTPNQRVFDCGIQTGDAIRELMRGTPAHAAGRTDEQANGNGSLFATPTSSPASPTATRARMSAAPSTASGLATSSPTRKIPGPRPSPSYAATTRTMPPIA